MQTQQLNVQRDWYGMHIVLCTQNGERESAREKILHKFIKIPDKQRPFRYKNQFKRNKTVSFNRQHFNLNKSIGRVIICSCLALGHSNILVANWTNQSNGLSFQKIIPTFQQFRRMQMHFHLLWNILLFRKPFLYGGQKEKKTQTQVNSNQNWLEISFIECSNDILSIVFQQRGFWINSTQIFTRISKLLKKNKVPFN